MHQKSGSRSLNKMPETSSSFSPRKNKGLHDRAESTYVPIHQPIFAPPASTPAPPVAPFALSHQELPIFTNTTTTADLFSPISSSSNIRDDYSKEKRPTPPLLSPPLRSSPSFPALRRRLTPQSSLTRAIVIVCLVVFYLLLHHRSALETSGAHPIPSLIARAEKAAQDATSRRPTTLQAAYEQYVIRHGGRRPPKGWDSWWNLSGQVEACEGEFKELYESLKPWWGVKPSEIRERIEALAKSGARGLGMVSVKGGAVVSWDEMVREGLPAGSKEAELDGTRVALEQMLKELKERFRVSLPDGELSRAGDAKRRADLFCLYQSISSSIRSKNRV